MTEKEKLLTRIFTARCVPDGLRGLASRIVLADSGEINPEDAAKAIEDVSHAVCTLHTIWQTVFVARLPWWREEQRGEQIETTTVCLPFTF